MEDRNSQTHTIKRFQRRNLTVEKSLPSNHYIQEVTSFELSVPCLVHFDQYITHICIECGYKCMCGMCLQEGAHKDHNIKNIEKGSKIVDRVLNESLIRLRSKADLLTHLNDSISIRKTDLFSEYKDYLQLLDNNFEILSKDLIQKKQLLVSKINSYYQSQVDKLTNVIHSITEETYNSVKMVEMICEKMENLQSTPLCLFYMDRKPVIESAVHQFNTQINSFKSQLIDIKWTLDYDIFDRMREEINTFQIVTSNEEIFLKGMGIVRKEKNLKTKDFKNDKIHKMSACDTPKNASTAKNSSFKSPRHINKKSSSRKLISMPASPSRDNSSKKITPSKNKLVKFRKSKKDTLR